MYIVSARCGQRRVDGINCKCELPSAKKTTVRSFKELQNLTQAVCWGTPGVTYQFQQGLPWFQVLSPVAPPRKQSTWQLHDGRKMQHSKGHRQPKYSKRIPKEALVRGEWRKTCYGVCTWTVDNSYSSWVKTWRREVRSRDCLCIIVSPSLQNESCKWPCSLILQNACPLSLFAAIGL